jgi:putative ABC transport system permease protein
MWGGLIAIPLSYFSIKIWLEDYAYKMPVDGSLLIIPLAVVCLLALATVSYQTIAAAKKNPVDHMKCE